MGYKKIDHVLQAEGLLPPFHWHEIRKKARPRIIKVLIESFFSSDIKMFIIQHERMPSSNRHKYFLSTVPRTIASALSPLLKKSQGTLELISDDDFNIKNIPLSCLLFARFTSEWKYAYPG
ncbi:MAG TPA: hypothetical protein VKM55_10035 [Candidatus Lokiarchaeia archaeon]|nr:hypothetical protein [Candidatus Lokiarchaeia archaeon]